MISTVIFDMDGVLIDSEPIHKTINQKYFEELGVPVSDKDYEQKFVGLPIQQMFVQLKQNHDLPAPLDELLDECAQRIYKGFEEANLKAAPGVAELLKDLKNKGLNLAVGSSSTKELISLVIKKIGLSDYFHHLVSGYEVENGKPSPDLFLHIADLFGADPDFCLVVEDSTLGVEASCRAGMKTIGVRNVSTVYQNLDKADFVVEDFALNEHKIILNAVSSL